MEERIFPAPPVPHPERSEGSATFRNASWRLWLDLVPRPGALNMAIDRSLLDRAARGGERWLRLYRWSPSCLSFGRHERATARYDRRRITELGLEAVRRPTGGRAVWHAGELTYAVALPADDAHGVRAAYLEVHRMLLEAVRRLGADPVLAPSAPTAGLDAGACFARPVGGEILVAGRKVVGSAQLREAGGLLQHGSILLDDDQAVVRDVTLGVAPADGSAPLGRLLGRPLPASEVAEAVARSAAARWGGTWLDVETLRDLPEEAAGHLARFASPEWTWRA